MSAEERSGIWIAGLGAILGLGGLAYIESGKGISDKFIVACGLFFLFLPLFNSLFDWLSWWATRYLGQRLLAVLAPEQGLWRRRLTVVAHSCADLAAAVVLLLLMAFALGMAFQAYDDLAFFQGGQGPLQLHSKIQALAQDPWHEGFWFSLMLLTTLLPTFGHGVILLGSPLGVALIPDAQRQSLADDLEQYDTAGARQVDICLRAARWHAQERLAGWGLGLLLFCWLLGRFMLLPLGLGHYAQKAACLGVQVAGGQACSGSQTR
jgi:hypothetical protein